MASIKSFPNNVDEYVGAENVMKWHYGRSAGVFGADGNLSVSALDTPAMAVNVSDGIAWMTDGGYNGIVAWNDNEDVNGAKLQLTVPTAHATYTRIDRVIIEWALPNFDHVPEIKILQGTAAASPAAPALTNTAAVRQISLARIAVAPGATVINSGDITDERLDSTVCGIVTDTVGVDTTVMSAQWADMVAALGDELARVIAGGLPSHAATHAPDGDDPLYIGSTAGKIVETDIGGVLKASRTLRISNVDPAHVTDLNPGDIYVFVPEL